MKLRKVYSSIKFKLFIIRRRFPINLSFSGFHYTLFLVYLLFQNYSHPNIHYSFLAVIYYSSTPECRNDRTL